MNEAVNEFLEVDVDKSQSKQNARQNNNIRVIVIFTSKFNLSTVDRNELTSLIFKLHVLKINVVIFGYEIGNEELEDEYATQSPVQLFHQKDKRGLPNQEEATSFDED